ncbi:MAG: hypothetical protein EA398_14420 [Deltaproteobacteria bacterium]|nr:MAG: hypothetical protein EA398_14420 [Deltaproteobacteria bacterium]
MQGVILFLGLTTGISLLVAALALGTRRWRTDRAVRALELECADTPPRLVLPALIGDGQRRGSGAIALTEDRLELRYTGAPPASISLRDVRRLSPQLSMRSLARYEAAAPTFGIVLRNGDTWDLVIMGGNRAALATLKDALER